MFFRKSKGQGTKGDGRIHMGSRKRRLLSEAVQVEEELMPPVVRPVLIVAAIMVLGFVFWSSRVHLTEVARAPGEIIPLGQNKVVQHLDGGIVEEITVSEFDLVQQGQVLLKLDGSQANAELKQTEARLVALKLRAERLEAFATGRTPDFESLAGGHSDLLADQMEIYRTQVSARDSALSIISHQINQRNRRIEQLNSALATAREHQTLSGELSSMREDLASRKLINRSVLLETRRASVTAAGEVERVNDEINVSSQELAESRSRYEDTLNQSRREALAEMGTVRAEIAEVEEAVQRLRDKVSRLEVKAPSRGYVQDIKVQTVGQVVQPGALLMQIVPDDTPLEAMIRISPTDIGYIRVGQTVEVRVSSYDYSRFGTAKGTLKRISASSVVGEDKQPYYRGWVALPQPYVGNEPGKRVLKSGMGVEAEILTGEKTLLEYLAKPVVSALTYSFRER